MTCRCTRDSCPEPVPVTIISTNIALNGITSYAVVDRIGVTAGTSINAGRTVATLSKYPASSGLLDVYINGVHDLSWTLSGNIITFGQAIPAGADIACVYLSSSPGTAQETYQTGDFKVWHTGLAVPDGWLECDGAAVSRTTYAALFAKIGTAYGVGDNSTTFNVPDRDAVLADGSTLENWRMLIKT